MPSPKGLGSVQGNLGGLGSRTLLSLVVRHQGRPSRTEPEEDQEAGSAALAPGGLGD